MVSSGFVSSDQHPPSLVPASPSASGTLCPLLLFSWVWLFQCLPLHTLHPFFYFIKISNRHHHDSTLVPYWNIDLLVDEWLGRQSHISGQPASWDTQLPFPTPLPFLASCAWVARKRKVDESDECLSFASWPALPNASLLSIPTICRV